MGIFQSIKKKLRFIRDKSNFSGAKEVKQFNIRDNDQMNYLWIVYDSCRYDSLVEANTPNLDKHAKIYSAWAPATYTLPSHVSFFAGVLPLVHEPIPYLNRFTKQLITMKKAEQAKEGAISDKTIVLPASDQDMVYGLRKNGFYTVGSGAATWFAKDILTKSFEDFKFKRAMAVEEQMNYLLKNLSKKATKKPFFAFMNLIETHTPYMHYGEDRSEYSMLARSDMQFPPKEDTERIATRGKKLHKAQIEAAEHLDKKLGEFLPQIPKNTLVIVTADHGECFGEDGFWGHGIYHPKVMNVPISCFMLNGENILEDKLI